MLRISYLLINKERKIMFKKSVIAGLVATALTPGLASAADAPEHSLSGNVGIASQYIFRGLTQTNTDPALQGGFDYSHSSGLYAGTWLSNISWLTDSPAATGYKSSSLEMDIYGGFKGAFGKSDFGYDVGLLYYYYPGSHDSGLYPGTVKADTLEAYGAVSWKWLSAKLSYSINDKTFGVNNSSGTYYVDLTANYPITDKLNLIAHYGNQKFEGSNGAISNDSIASYEDYKLGISYTLPKDFTVGAYYTDTSMDSTQEAFYTNSASNRFVGKDTFTVFVSKTF
jgi:uncharacterized protein (TIGR02001 family)